MDDSISRGSFRGAIKKSLRNYLFLLFGLVLSPSIASAQELRDFKGLTEFATNLISAQGLVGLFNNLFSLALLLGSIVAVILIAVSGIQYMTTDAVSSKKDSIERIRQAVIGLIMLLSVWLFFNQINPQILTLDFLLQDTSLKDGDASAPEGSGIPYTGPTSLGGANTYSSKQYTNATWVERNSLGCGVQGSDWESVEVGACGSIDSSKSQSDLLCCAQVVTTTPVSGDVSFYTTRELQRGAGTSGQWCYQVTGGFRCASTKTACESETTGSGGSIGRTCRQY